MNVNMPNCNPGFQLEDEKMRGLYIMKLVRSFCASSSHKEGQFQFFFLLNLLSAIVPYM